MQHSQPAGPGSAATMQRCLLPASAAYSSFTGTMQRCLLSASTYPAVQRRLLSASAALTGTMQRRLLSATVACPVLRIALSHSETMQWAPLFLA